jgi:hypothetical protein
VIVAETRYLPSHLPRGTDEDNDRPQLEYEGGGFIKKSTSYGIEKIYLLYIFPPELHTLMTSLF